MNNRTVDSTIKKGKNLGLRIFHYVPLTRAQSPLFVSGVHSVGIDSRHCFVFSLIKNEWITTRALNFNKMILFAVDFFNCFEKAEYYFVLLLKTAHLEKPIPSCELRRVAHSDSWICAKGSSEARPNIIYGTYQW